MNGQRYLPTDIIILPCKFHKKIEEFIMSEIDQVSKLNKEVRHRFKIRDISRLIYFPDENDDQNFQVLNDNTSLKTLKNVKKIYVDVKINDHWKYPKQKLKIIPIQEESDIFLPPMKRVEKIESQSQETISPDSFYLKPPAFKPITKPPTEKNQRTASEPTKFQFPSISSQKLTNTPPTEEKPKPKPIFQSITLSDSVTRTFSQQPHYLSSYSSHPGSIGCRNLGNTCYFNSGIQCIMHSLPLSRFLLSDHWREDINETNPLGMKGKLVRQFAALNAREWLGEESALDPSALKSVTGQFAHQFSGYQQQDPHELIMFMLDGIHEDLNRCRMKPQVETVTGDSTNDAQTALTAWKNHKLRNDSIIVDLFHGQLRSRCICPKCNCTTVVFDPYVALSLPIAPPNQKAAEVLYIPYDMTEKHQWLSIKVPRIPTVTDYENSIRDMIGSDVAVAFLADGLYGTKLYWDPTRANYSTNLTIVAFEIPLDDAWYVPVQIYISLQGEFTWSTSSQPTSFFCPFLVEVPNTDINPQDLADAVSDRMEYLWDGKVEKEEEEYEEEEEENYGCSKKLPPHIRAQIEKAKIKAEEEEQQTEEESEPDLANHNQIVTPTGKVLRFNQNQMNKRKHSDSEEEEEKQEENQQQRKTYGYKKVSAKQLPKIAEQANSNMIRLGASSQSSYAEEEESEESSDHKAEEKPKIIVSQEEYNEEEEEEKPEKLRGIEMKSSSEENDNENEKGSEEEEDNRNEPIQPSDDEETHSTAHSTIEEDSQAHQGTGNEADNEDIDIESELARSPDTIKIPDNIEEQARAMSFNPNSSVSDTEDSDNHIIPSLQAKFDLLPDKPDNELENRFPTLDPPVQQTRPSILAPLWRKPNSDPLPLLDSHQEAKPDKYPDDKYNEGLSSEMRKIKNRIRFNNHGCSATERFVVKDPYSFSPFRFISTDLHENISNTLIPVLINSEVIDVSKGFCLSDFLMHVDTDSQKKSVTDSRGEQVSLDQCFSYFKQEETLDQDNMWFCPHCRDFVCANKKMDIWSCPKLLVIQLKRFETTETGSVKDEKLVSFPQDLDMREHIVGPIKKSTKYRLYAVSEHYGSCSGGHCTAKATVPSHSGPRDWFSFDDSRASKTSFRDVMTRAAYVLFYERVDGNNDDNVPEVLNPAEDTKTPEVYSSSFSSSSIFSNLSFRSGII